MSPEDSPPRLYSSRYPVVVSSLVRGAPTIPVFCLRQFLQGHLLLPFSSCCSAALLQRLCSASFHSSPFRAQAQSSRMILLPIFQMQITIDNAKRLGGFHEKPSKHFTVFSPETVNIKKMANLTANTKNYGQITLTEH